MFKKVEEFVDLGEGKVLRFETGLLAKQAAGSAVINMGDAVLLATMCYGAESPSDFFPLTVEYKEKAYAVGKIPGGYIKRETKPSDLEVLSARLIDRPIRPMFPKGMSREVQVVVNVLSADKAFECDVLGVSAASLANGLSDIPFEEQVAAVKVVKCDDKYIVFPTIAEQEEAELELIVAGSATSVVMVEGSAFEVSEETVIEAIQFAHECIKKMCAGQELLVQKAGKPKGDFSAKPSDEQLVAKVKEWAEPRLQEAFHKPTLKKEHYQTMDELGAQLIEYMGEEYAERTKEVKSAFDSIKKHIMREMVMAEGIRIDGRKTDEIREIDIAVGVLPSSHGSSIFQRGETQALATCTLGTKSDEQRVESLQGEVYKNYMLHYNFPPYSVGEVKRMMSISRREIGHGQLAERALAPVLPHPEDFPYTIRIVSEVLESHGSSSMATVCGGSLALMDAGVPVKSGVAGIAMGLISDETRTQILSDINGTEDALGDMDFKVAGTEDGVTALQMDIKIKGITSELMSKALEQAKAGRMHILGKMKEIGLAVARNDLSEQAPTVLSCIVPVSKIREVIGPGGNVIRGIQANTGTTLNINDDGKVEVSAPNRKAAEYAMKMVQDIIAEIEPNKVYKGKVKSIVNFGAFVEVFPGKEGLVHISEIEHRKINSVEEVLSLGEEVDVKCIGVDPRGKIKLSIKALKEQPVVGE